MRFLRKIITKICFFASYLVPRKKNLFVFIGWHKKNKGEVFADNAKYFFLFMSQHHPDVQSVWIAKSRELAQKLRDHGYLSYYEKSLRGIWHQLRAGYFVIDAFLQPNNYMLSGRSKIVQLLHGKGMKKKGYAERPEKKQDFIFNTSPFTLEMLPAIFKSGSTTYITGYPRNDIFFQNIKDALIDIDESLYTHVQSLKPQTKIIMYAPTFRRGQKEFDIEHVLPHKKLIEFAQQNNVFFILSLHNKYRLQQNEGHIEKHFAFLEESDIYPLLPLVDILITDYSSSFADFLLLDRPLIFYAYDLEDYDKKEGLVANYDEITPGPKVKDPEELFQAIHGSLTSDAHGAERKRVRDLYHTYQDGNSSERIWKKISEDS